MSCNCSHLQDKTVVITGAGGRLGQRLVARFEEIGAHVVSVGRADTTQLTLDLTKEAEVRDAFARIKHQYDRIDALVHAVGMWSEWPLLDTRLEDWEHMMRVNLTSSFLCFREAARQMLPAGGTLIGICARSGLEAAVARGGAYAASKAGLLRLVEAVAAEYPVLRTYALAPSIIRYGKNTGTGVHADDLTELAIQLCSESAAALSGTALQAYGNQ